MLLQGGKVLRTWAGKAVVCIATGPSLTEAQLEVVRRARAADMVRVITVNDAYLVAPFADVLYYADQKWRQWQMEGRAIAWPWRRFDAAQVREAFASFAGQKCSVIDSRSYADTCHLKILLDDGLSLDPAGLAAGKHSGHQALNVAALSGGNPILLLGYNAGRPSRMMAHAFGEHPDKSAPPYEAMRATMQTTQGPLREFGARVVNCTPDSAIECFERGRVEVELERLLPHPRAAELSA